MRKRFHIPGITHNNSNIGVKKIEYLDPVVTYGLATYNLNLIR